MADAGEKELARDPDKNARGDRAAGQKPRGLSAGIHMVPGSQTSCALITVLTVMLAAFASNPTIDPVLRTLYFAVLFAAFHAIRRREASLDITSFRLIELGFLVLTLGFSAFAIMRLTGLEDRSPVFLLLSHSFERGAVFLLGVSLITYGILLSMPAIVESYRVLREDYLQTRGKLREVRHSHRRMENRIVEAEQYRALGELAAGVAHDLRNPLTIVKAAAEALVRKERDPEDVQEHSRVIQRNIEKAERTITALLDLGKPHSPQLREVDLAAVITEVIALVRPEARRRHVTIDSAGAAALRVETDGKLLSQALLNLLLNALQASAPDRVVVVRTRRFRLGGTPMAAILVEDRGSGLQADDRGQLFSPFFTTKDGGTGLGLLSCRRVLKELGGRIGLFPRLRGGARAVALLPLRRGVRLPDGSAGDGAPAARDGDHGAGRPGGHAADAIAGRTTDQEVEAR